MDLTPSSSPSLSSASNNLENSQSELEQQSEQIGSNPNKMTPEQEEEMKLRMKYPNPQKPGGSSFIQKMLHKGNKKYFDSGDYNMAKSKNKALINKAQANAQQQAISPQTGDYSVTTTTSTISESPNNTLVSPSSTGDLNSTNLNPTTPNININLVNNGTNNGTNHSTTPLASNINIINSNLNTTNILSSTNLYPTSPSVNYLSTAASNNINMSNSISSSSLQILSASLSTDKLSNIHLNTSLTNVLDGEEIGHGIPTPECLPQSRKHSIAQSKLATPRLSTS